MYLHEIPKGSKIMVNTGGSKVLVTFHHPDGMYSYCTVDDGPDKDKVLHLNVMTPLKKNDGEIEDYYTIMTDEEIKEEAFIKEKIMKGVIDEGL